MFGGVLAQKSIWSTILSPSWDTNYFIFLIGLSDLVKQDYIIVRKEDVDLFTIDTIIACSRLGNTYSGKYRNSYCTNNNYNRYKYDTVN